MRNEILISDVRFVAATERQRLSGLLGWVTCILCGLLHLEGMTIRRMLNGEIKVQFPRRFDEYGIEHHFFFPAGEAVRAEIVRQVLEAIGLVSSAAEQ